MRIPEGWQYVSDYCIKRGDFTICRVGGADGWRYELWCIGDQMEVNLASSQAAVEAWEKLQKVSRETNS